MTYDVLQFSLVLIVFTAFVFIVIPLLKILVMIDVFGWDKTKELLQNPDWKFGHGAKEKIDKALQELETHGEQHNG